MSGLEDEIGTYLVKGAFANADQSIINWNGENYFQSCDEQVMDTPEFKSHCVKRKDHPGDIHEDYDGNRKTDEKNKYIIVVAVPLGLDPASFAEVSEVMQVLKGQLDQKEGRLIYNAVLDKADQVIMILEGDG